MAAMSFICAFLLFRALGQTSLPKSERFGIKQGQNSLLRSEYAFEEAKEDTEQEFTYVTDRHTGVQEFLATFIANASHE